MIFLGFARDGARSQLPPQQSNLKIVSNLNRGSVNHDSQVAHAAYDGITALENAQWRQRIEPRCQLAEPMAAPDEPRHHTGVEPIGEGRERPRVLADQLPRTVRERQRQSREMMPQFANLGARRA
jgi:hypothetical protein